VVVVQASHERFYASMVGVGDYSRELVSYETRYVTASDQVTIFVMAYGLDIVSCSLCGAYYMPCVVSYDKDPLVSTASTGSAS
jgi:hypothetical protein